jgi:hypothetical protein
MLWLYIVFGAIGFVCIVLTIVGIVCFMMREKTNIDTIDTTGKKKMKKEIYIFFVLFKKIIEKIYSVESK